MGLVIQMSNDHSKRLRMLKITRYGVNAIYSGGYLVVVIQYYVVLEFFRCIFSRVDECIFSRDVACMVRNLKIKFCELRNIFATNIQFILSNWKFCCEHAFHSLHFKVLKSEL